MLTHKNLEVWYFKNQKDYEKWLSKNHDQTKYYDSPKGIWVRLYKKDSGVETLQKDEMIDTSICWGWIDGLINSYDEKSYLIKTTPRGLKSIWSKINVDKVAKLTKENRMKPSGLYHVELAKKDGRWAAAYEPPSKITTPKEFMNLLNKNKQAKEFYDSLTKSNKYTISFQISTAVRPETKQRRLQKYFEMMKNKQKPN